MDKRVIFAVAGAGKTTYIVNSLNDSKRFLIITYTNANYNNIARKIADKFHGKWPDNITLLTYFKFLYNFCYRPFLSYRYPSKGLIFEQNTNRYIRQDNIQYYQTTSGYFYSNRLSLFLDKNKIMDDIKNRIEKYFDELIIDEIQDIGGRDFTFLEKIMDSNVNMLFVGDYYQHTFSTSFDGNVNKNLFDDQEKYMQRFSDKGVIPDTNTLRNSWRCTKTICKYISVNLKINIRSNREEDSVIQTLSNPTQISQIMNDESVEKLHYQGSSKFGNKHKNWGDTKGEDCYKDVCVVLNKTTMSKFTNNLLYELSPTTRNKLYVAITRAHRNVYFVDEASIID